jgi:hypothetical protein
MENKSNKNLTMMKTWGYKIEEESKMLREISNDSLTPKKHDFMIQNEIHAQIRNDDDYDDWEYGTEPLYELQKPL